MHEADNIRAVEALGIDMMGFIFWPKSSRYVSQRPDYLPKHVKRVGVFVDEDPEQVRRLADDYGLDYIQLHGHESPDYIRAIMTTSSIIHHPSSRLSISLLRMISYRRSPTKDSSITSSSTPKAPPLAAMVRSSTGTFSPPTTALRPSSSPAALVPTTQRYSPLTSHRSPQKNASAST